MNRLLKKCHNIQFSHTSICTIHGIAIRITESAKSGTKVFVEQVYHSPIGMNDSKNYGCEFVTFLLH